MDEADIPLDTRAPLVFYDGGIDRREIVVLEFTQALAKDPRGAAFIGAQVAGNLAQGKCVYVKVHRTETQTGGG